MIHLVRSVPRSHSGASSSTTLSIVNPTEKSIEPPVLEAILETEVEAEGVRLKSDPNDDSMASRALVVLEHLGAMYPVETSRAIAPVTMSPTMKDLYQNLTVQHVAFNIPSTPAQQTKLPANAQMVQDYPSQLLQAPLIPVRARKSLPSLPFLEVGSGLLAFTIVSGVVVVDGLKQAQNGPGPGKRTSPISSTVNDRTTRVAQAKAGMSDMEVLKSGRTLPVPGLAMGAPTGLSMGGMNLTPAQMSQLAMQQAIAFSSKVGTATIPPTSVIPQLNSFAPPQTGEALPAVPTGTVGTVGITASSSPTVPQSSEPQPISLSPPVLRPRSPIHSSAPERKPIARQTDRPSVRPPVVTQPMTLPVPELPSSAAAMPIAPPEPPMAPSPSPSPAMPIVRQSMMPGPTLDAVPIEKLPRQTVPAKAGEQSGTKSSATQAVIQDEGAAVTSTPSLTPRVLTSMRPETSDSIAPAPALIKSGASQDFVPKELVFKQEVN